MKLINLITIIMISINVNSQLINQNFSNTIPTGWLTTGTYLCVMNFDGTATGNFRNVVDGTKSSVRFPSASNGGNTFLYIPINFVSGNDYNITFYTKRACSVTLNTNETANQTTLLTTQTLTNSSCASNWSNWYEWNFVVNSTYTGSGYIQINFPTIYGGPTSAYLDDFSVYEINPLPISLLYFNGTVLQRKNLLKWATLMETNNDFFTIEKSRDGITWNPIAYKTGNSTSYDINLYSVYDANPEYIINYYRLKQTDYNGYHTYSDIIAIDNRIDLDLYIEKIVNTLGQEVKLESYNGLIIIYYSNGSVVKTVK